ncbi:S41 family peptidase [Clostridium brassicae]|uniref:S41 family peptidase n=1 Tax=Clostridium brassicae TaxID=2999072 RepID=A0ABT4D6R9_9CLOT|nr:S41 family peptidase [Clostridium brassicae]MCY6957989.1 S41 family peptidase [Clostridium brassicae]
MKKRILAGLMVGVMCFALLGCDNSGKYICKSGDRVEAWQNDIDYLAEELPKRHKNLFFKLGKDEFHNKITNLKQSINKMNDDEVRIEINKIMTSIGDGHTGSNISSEKMFPIDLYWFNDGIYAINTTDEYSQIKYGKLKKINNTDIKSIIKDMSNIITHDNESGVKSQIKYYIIMPTVLQPLHIIDNKDTAKFTFEDKNGKDIEITMKSLDSEIVFNRILNKGKSGRNIPLYMKNQDKAYWFQYLNDSKVMYFNYSKCVEYDDDKSFEEFSKELMAAIEKEQVKKLVIDLRNNRGGSSRVLNGFIKKISKSELNKNGKIFVIVGRETFSSAILNAISLKQDTKAIFVGENTSGKPNHYGEVKKFKLPNTNTTIRYSTKYFNNYDKDISSFIPDKKIELSINDYINNNDPIMDYITKK